MLHKSYSCACGYSVFPALSSWDCSFPRRILTHFMKSHLTVSTSFISGLHYVHWYICQCLYSTTLFLLLLLYSKFVVVAIVWMQSLMYPKLASNLPYSQDDLELLIFQLTCSRCWHYRHAPSCQLIALLFESILPCNLQWPQTWDLLL